MPYTPTKRCDKPEIHEPHIWKENRVFRRQCPGRLTTRRTQASRKAAKRNRNEGNIS